MSNIHYFSGRLKPVCKLFLGGLLFSLVTYCIGCGPWRVPSYSPDKPAVEKQASSSVVALDKKLVQWISSRKIKVASERADWTPDGRLQVSLELENRTKETFPVQIQTVFKDRHGSFTEDKTNWEYIILTKKSITLYKATALSKESEGYLIRIKLPEE